MVGYEQGDILRIEGIKCTCLVVSCALFNKDETVMVCPLSDNTCDHPLHIFVYDDKENPHTVLCEHVMFHDLSLRGYSVTGRIPYGDLINVSDALQSIFEY